MNKFLPYYEKLFNVVFDSGESPKSWTAGIIKAIYKNKGDPNDPDNYRAISLVSSLGKVFTSILNTRLNKFSDEVNLISDAQSGFRAGYSTCDNIFILYSLIALFLSQKKKLFCTFIDFKKAFDTIWRAGLWRKLIKNNIQGKMFKIIFSLYKNIKSCVKAGGEYSDFFACDIGVRQGENLSPFLFALYLNDLEDFLSENCDVNLKTLNDLCEENLNMYLKLFLLLYADDTVLFAESIENLKNVLKVFENYCERWKLKVNVKKTKIVVFSKRRYNNDQLSFEMFGEKIDVQDDYNYLGVLFNYNGNFFKARKKLVEQSQKALYSLYSKIRNINIPVDLQLKLFDTLVLPILTYSSEIWGFENKGIIEKIHLQFCKKILGVRSSTPNFMVYGELGRFPIEISIKIRMICFWNKMLMNENKLSSKIYRLLFNLHVNGNRDFKWINYVKSIFDETGFSHLWNDQIPLNTQFLKLSVKQRLQDHFIQKWFSDMINSSRGEFYSKFKSEFKLENYLLNLNSTNRTYITKLRTCNLKFPIETGRWLGVPKEERLCNLCKNSVGNEFHYIFCCEMLNDVRAKHLNKYFLNNPNEIKMYKMLNIGNTQVLTQLSILLKKIVKVL